MQMNGVQELNDLDLEMFSAGKGGKGGGGGGGISRGLDNMLKFQQIQRNNFINSGVNPGSSSFERLARRGVDLRGIGIDNMRGAGR